MTDIYLVDGARTPHGKFLESLADVAAVDLGATAVEGLLDRTPIAGAEVDWLGLGNAIAAGIGQAPARQVGVRAGFPEGVPATTINEASGSGLRAITLAVDRLQAGRKRVAVAGGFESMSQAPYVAPGMRQGHRHGDVTLKDSMILDALWDLTYDAHMGELTEALVDRFDISRTAQDAYAAESHRRAAAAIDGGAFDDELVPVETADGELDRDEGPRPETTVEGLGDLPPAFERDGTITAGNASDLSDGAGVVLLATADAVDDVGADPLARVVDYAVAYRDPQWFGMSVADAVDALLDANDLGVDDVAHFELNEAFAAQMVYVEETLGVPRAKLNPNGGAIALGHPIGASGGILTVSLAFALREADARYGVVGMSVGGGGGIAMLLERSD